MGNNTTSNSKNHNLPLTFITILCFVFISFGIICIVNDLVNTPFLGDFKNSWKFGTIFIIMPTLVLIIVISNLIQDRAKAKNKPLPKFNIQSLLPILIPLVIMACIVLATDNYRSLTFILPIAFCGVIFALMLFKIIRAHYLTKKKTNALSDCTSSIKRVATYAGCELDNTISSSDNGRLTSYTDYYNIIFTYSDEFGKIQTKKSAETFTLQQVTYLKTLKTFEITINKKDVFITENLNNIPSFTINPQPLNQQAQNTSSQIPFFAKPNFYTKALFILLGFSLIPLVIGLIFTSLFSVASIILTCVTAVIFIISLISLLPYVICEHKGTPEIGQFLGFKINSRIGRSPDNDEKLFNTYAIVKFNNKEYKLLILNDEHYALLSNYVNKDIPIKVYKRTLTIDFAKIYSNFI